MTKQIEIASERPKARQNKFLSDKKIKSIKTILLKEKEKLVLKELTQDSFCLDTNELSDVLDEARENVETSKMLRFRNREIFYLKKINKSLERIDQGIYGLCDDCEDEISFERLMARPTADLCIGCKEEAEMTEKNNFHQKKSKSLGKTMAEI